MNTWIMRTRSVVTFIVVIVGAAALTFWAPAPSAQEARPASRPKPPATIAEDSDFFLLGLRESLEEVTNTLKLEDDVQKELFAFALKSGPKSLGSPSSLSIVLLLPYKKETIREHQFEWRNPGQAFVIKVVKVASGAISRPLGVISYNCISDCKFVITEKVVFFDQERRWYEGKRDAE